MNFHEANIQALKKIGALNATRLMSPSFICNVIKEHIYNATAATIQKQGEQYVLTITFGDVVDNFLVTMSYNETEKYYKITNFE